MTNAQFTDEQRKAILTHDRNLIVMAGAGSGKTFVLVERYLALLDAHNKPEIPKEDRWRLNQLVAITFTRKAAQEMRDRVRQALENRLRSANDAGDDEQAQLWADLVSQMDSARIDTIHGLCASLLRANAAEAGVDPDFAVLDEVEAGILLDDVIDRVLADVIEMGDDALALFEHYGMAGVRSTLANPALLALDLPTLPDDLMAEWQDLHLQATRVGVTEFLAFVEQSGTFEPVDGDLIGDQWRDCLRWLGFLSNGTEEHYYDALLGICAVKLTGGKQDSWGGKDILQEAKATLKLFREAATDILKQIGEPPGERDAQAAEFLPLWVDLIQRVSASFAEIKQQNSLLDFDDLESLTRNLFIAYPEVKRRYRDNEFKHLLVDEFQDTNQRQWDIIKGLASLRADGAMFVVGDEKQSIYAFRGADVSVFGDVKQEITGNNGESLTLSQSFRTHQPLIATFNHLFSRLLTRDENSPVGAYQVTLDKKMSATRVPPQDAPLIDFILINSATELENGERAGAEKARQWEAYEIAQLLKAKVGTRLIYDKGEKRTRVMRYDDVAILFRSLSQVNLYENVFKAQGIPFVTVAGRGYYDRQEVWDLLSLLKALHNPSDNLSLAVALRSPLFGLSDDALFALRLRISDADATSEENTTRKLVPVRLWDALALPNDKLPADEVERVEFARKTLYALKDTSGRVTISELLRDALARTGYLAVLSGLPDGARRRGNVEKILEKAQSSGKITLGAFAQYLGDLSAREVREGEAALDVEGAVTIMTIHASKGLEYPMIVLADASWDRGAGGAKSTLVYDETVGLACTIYDPDADKFQPTFVHGHIERLTNLRDSAESLRLLYVAATRAQDALVISGQVASKASGWTIKGWLPQLLDGFNLFENFDEVVNNVIDYTLDDGTRGTINLFMPENFPPEEAFTFASDDAHSGWETREVRSRLPIGDDLFEPPLLAEVSIRREAQVRHIAATDIANLGEIEHEIGERSQFYKDRFRRRVLHDAPATIEQIGKKQQGVRARQVGEIVHEVLRWWRFPEPDKEYDYHRLLRSYAWRQGITDDRLCQEAADKAYALILKFTQSEMFQRLERADAVYRELPFIYEVDGRIIHGIIDTLYRIGEQWVIVDYKTSAVQQAHITANIDDHARRYHLQVGVYAQAVSEQLNGIVPETYVHYIRYTHTVKVEESVWRKALSRRLTERIVDVIE
ncbi:MAG: UvrD-helicase domain-containing protein [Aggregatilineales bacterium]